MAEMEKIVETYERGDYATAFELSLSFAESVTPTPRTTSALCTARAKACRRTASSFVYLCTTAISKNLAHLHATRRGTPVWIGMSGGNIAA